MPLLWPIIGSLVASFTVTIMTIFSSCCTGSESDDDQKTASAPSHLTTGRRNNATAACRETPEFRAVRYSDTVPGASHSTDASARSSESSRLSPRATPSRCPQTPIGTSADATGNPEDVSPSVYSRPSRLPTASSIGTVCYAERKTEGPEAVSKPIVAEEQKVDK